MKIIDYKNTQNIVTEQLANGRTRVVKDSDGNSIPIKDSFTTNVKFVIQTDTDKDSLPKSIDIATMISYQKQHQSGKLQLKTKHEPDSDNVVKDVKEYVLDESQTRAIDWKPTEQNPIHIVGYSVVLKPEPKPFVKKVYNLVFGAKAVVKPV